MREKIKTLRFESEFFKPGRSCIRVRLPPSAPAVDEQRSFVVGIWDADESTFYYISIECLDVAAASGSELSASGGPILTLVGSCDLGHVNII